MFNIKELINSRTGSIVISIILGLGIAALFKKSCEGGKCIVFQAPPKDISNKIYKHNSKCIKFTPETTKCNKSPIE
jgi:hypothetical protein|tara:strand:+ start:188 stop:415 length:228 start_codon:yes stop_codon:yes gene_type:complete